MSTRASGASFDRALMLCWDFHGDAEKHVFDESATSKSSSCDSYVRVAGRRT